MSTSTAGAEPSLPPGLAMVCAFGCIGYLLPAWVSFKFKRYWQAFVFATLAALGVVHYVAGSWLMRPGPAQFAASVLPRWTQLAALCVAFAVLGPEDPLLQRGGFDYVPSLDVLAMSRVVPAVMLLGELISCVSCSEVAAATLIEALLVAAVASYWLSTAGRRARARDVLPRAAYWKRAWQLLVFPGILLAVPLLILVSSSGQAQAHAATSVQLLTTCLLMVVAHVGFAAAATVALRSVFTGEVEVLDRSNQNRLVAHLALFGPFCVLVPMVALALIFDAVAHREWRWATLSMAATTPTSATVLSVGALPLALSSAVVYWVLHTIAEPAASETALPTADTGMSKNRLYTSMGEALKSKDQTFGSGWRESETRNQSRMLTTWRPISMGCYAGLFSLACGCGSAFVVEGTPFRNAIHVLLTIGFFVMMILSGVLITIGSKLSGTMGLLRLAILFGLLVTFLVQSVTFFYVNQYIPNTYKIPHWIYASSEYLTLGFLAALPMTWVSDVAAAEQVSRM